MGDSRMKQLNSEICVQFRNYLFKQLNSRIADTHFAQSKTIAVYQTISLRKKISLGNAFVLPPPITTCMNSNCAAGL